MWSPERNVPRFKCLSYEHSFSCSCNLYEHHRTFTNHRPQPKLQGGHRFISGGGLKAPATGPLADIYLLKETKERGNDLKFLVQMYFRLEEGCNKLF